MLSYRKSCRDNTLSSTPALQARRYCWQGVISTTTQGKRFGSSKVIRRNNSSNNLITCHFSSDSCKKRQVITYSKFYFCYVCLCNTSSTAQIISFPPHFCSLRCCIISLLLSWTIIQAWWFFLAPRNLAICLGIPPRFTSSLQLYSLYYNISRYNCLYLNINVHPPASLLCQN